MTDGFPGWITIVEMERLARKSLTGAQCAPLSTVFQMPPETLPANHVDGTMGLTAIDLTRPPMLPGPSHVQLEPPIPAAEGAPSAGPPATSSRARCASRICLTCSLAR